MDKQQTIDCEDIILTNKNCSITCLGIVFSNDDERQKYFKNRLREVLKNPDFHKTEGFPLGSDDDIIALSDPPYYTACPNPWIVEFIKEWNNQKFSQSESCQYHREPFATDVSEGKNDPIYLAHSYHTKVPHKAIMRYILHYTEPGDIVFDGFCGTGMTGVAAIMCGDRNEVLSLGYQVKPDGTILREEMENNGKRNWVPFSKLGIRHAILNDLSPAASFIASNYNTPVKAITFEKDAKRILDDVEKECGWMYETKHTDGRMGKINFVVWSDVFICPYCAGEVIFWDVAVNMEAGKVNDDFYCPQCSALLTKQIMSRARTTKYDYATKETINQAKQVPVLINYTVSGKRKEKLPDELDLKLLEKIEHGDIPYWYPTNRMIEGKETRRNDPAGITHVHHFYSKRNLWTLAVLNHKCSTSKSQCKLIFQSIATTLCSRLVRYNLGNRGNGPLSGTLYISSLNAESEITRVAKGKINDFLKAFIVKDHSLVSCQSLENTSIPSNSLDYIFIDPPFGSNLNYSELNFLWESWHRVVTNNKQEAIENEVQGKSLAEYRGLMTICFKETYRVLKPGHWMTVEFSNTKASVWNSIQTALTEAGFIIANVSALDKKQGSFKAVTTPTAVKQDLIISAYKPNGGFEDRFQKEVTTDEGVWDFINTHLKYLPVAKYQGAMLQIIPERDPRILFDQMVAYYVRKGYPVPISSNEFQVGLAQRFIERDGMYFLPEQAAEYDRNRMKSGSMVQITLFVSDESTSIQWLRQLLKEKPQTFQDINPLYMQQLGRWSKNEQQLDLQKLLEQNFIRYDGTGPVPEQIHAYLSSNWKEMRNLPKDDPTLMTKARDRWYVPDPNKMGDLEKIREKALLKEFEEYRLSKKKLKIIRLEAVRTGFKKAWQEHDYNTIVEISNKIPQEILEEDQKLLMWYDQAVTRVGEK